MEIKLGRIVRQINTAYYMVYTGTVLSSLVGFTLTNGRNMAPNPKGELSIAISSLMILYTMVAIPAALYLFHKKLSVWRAIQDDFLKQRTYIKAAQLRLIVVGSALIGSVISHFYLYANTTNYSLIFTAGIAAIGLYFCKPTRSKVASDLDIEDEEEE